MNLTNKVLKVLGMGLSNEMLKTDLTPEVKLWRAVLTMAIEDVLNTSQTRNESIAKAQAHDWFVENSNDFQNVCYNAGLDADWVRDRYILALDTGIVRFTQKQHLFVRYFTKYNQLKEEKDQNVRKKLQKIIEELRKKLFKS